MPGLLTGDWDVAIESGLRAIERADRNGYARAGLWTWMALGALVHARGERELLDRLRAWHEKRRPLLSRVPSPFARLMFEALVVRLSDAGMPIDRLIDQPPIPQTFAVPFRQPAWFAGADAVFARLVDEGELTDAEAALAEFAARNREWSSSMSLGFEDLLRARLVVAEAGAFEAHAEHALERFRAITAPWWEAKALRLLGRVAEAKPIEERLRIAGEAR